MTAENTQILSCLRWNVKCNVFHVDCLFCCPNKASAPFSHFLNKLVWNQNFSYFPSKYYSVVAFSSLELKTIVYFYAHTSSVICVLWEWWCHTSCWVWHVIKCWNNKCKCCGMAVFGQGTERDTTLFLNSPLALCSVFTCVFTYFPVWGC